MNVLKTTDRKRITAYDNGRLHYTHKVALESHTTGVSNKIIYTLEIVLHPSPTLTGGHVITAYHETTD